MAVYARRVNARSDTATTDVKSWQASTPYVPGVDALHTFASNPRRVYPTDMDPVPAQAGEIPSVGPHYTSRIAPDIDQPEWDARNPRGAHIREDLVQQDANGELEERHALAPINPAVGARHTGRQPARITQYYGPRQYTLQRRFGPPIARRFGPADHVSFATPPTAQIGDYGTGKGPRKNLRNTQRIVPTPDALQTVSIPEQYTPQSPMPSGSSLTRYW